MVLLAAVIAISISTAAFAAYQGPELNHDPVKNGKHVTAIYYGEDAQPFTEPDGDEEELDTIWVYYDDMTFEQFAEVDEKTCLFSEGTYSFANNSDFVYDENDANPGGVIITRTQKYQTGKGLAPYDSTHEYDFTDIAKRGFVKIYPDSTDSDSAVVTVFYGDDKQPFTEEDGDQEMVDTAWIYFDDGTFKQYAEVEENDQDKIVLFSQGNYAFADDGHFVCETDEPEHGTIIITRTHKYQTEKGLVPYDSVHDFNLGTLGFVQLLVISDIAVK